MRRLSVVGLLCAPILAHAATLLEGVRVWRTPEHARFVFDLSGPVRHKLTVADDPERLIIDLGDSRLRAPLPALDLSATPISGLRSGMLDARTLRLVLDLVTDVESSAFLLAPSGGRGQRLVLDLSWKPLPKPAAAPAVALAPATTAATNRSAAASPATVAAPAPGPAAAIASNAANASLVPEPAPAAGAEPARLSTPLPSRGRKILVAIDAGHGGEDPGAIGPQRVREKNVVLAIARELERRVNAQPGYRATLTRNGDYFIPLTRRPSLARKAGADMFVSIHADAFTHSRARGGSVYALSQRGATSVSAAFLAQRENGADLIGGVNLGEKDTVLAGVLTDLSMTATMDASLTVGGRVLNSMRGVTHLHKHRVEQAGFVVLKSPDMPSILVETGFISNPYEAEKLNSPRYQKQMAEVIFKGLHDYFLDHPPPETQLAYSDRSDRDSEYVIARGDTLSGIAERYRVSVSDIIKTNRLGGGNSIQAGQTIQIPQI